MSGQPPLALADFSAFFRAVHGQDPFPWQERLIRAVATDGWPRLLDLPTGTGKTAALDVAVFALALSAGGEMPVPRRIIYVVDRRTIVSQAHDRALRLREAITSGDADVLSRVRARLGSLSGGGVPLRTAELRGGIARDDMWSRTPDQPLIAVSTVDQVGSRLLFRGYGVTDAMKPIHAGLLGNDVLYLLDEVHLSQPFKETLSAVSSRYRSWADVPIAAPFVVVEMSATPGEPFSQAFTLDEDDRSHPVLARRLRSSKLVTLVSAKPRRLVDEIVAQVETMVGRPGATIGVVVNRVKTARELHRRLQEKSRVAHLVTGRMRPFDRDVLDRTLLPRIRAGRIRSTADEPVVVVATQTIEAGADFDFDGMVIECASLDAIRQRFGRLDRLGDLDGKGRGVVVAPHDVLKDDPVYGMAIGKTWEWLNTMSTDGVVDFGIEALNVPADVIELGVLAPRAHAPVLLPAHLDAWVQTAPIPTPDPDVALWLHGPERGTADVQVVWRADLTEALLSEAADSVAALEVVLGMVEALPPVSAEAMSVPYAAARRWLEGREEPDVADVEGAPNEPDDPKSKGDSKPKPALVWRGDKSQVVLATAIRPGQTIVIPADYGGITAGNWDPAATAPVTDVAEVAAFHAGRPPVLRLHDRIAQALVGVRGPEPTDDEEVVVRDRDLVGGWLASLDLVQTKESMRTLVEALRSGPKAALRVVRVPLSTESAGRSYFVVSNRRRSKDQDSLADDRVFADGTESSFTGVEVPLRAHQDAVATLAAAYAGRCGMGDSIVADMRLCGLWHDAGKHDVRFQRWLYGGSEFKVLVQAEPIAKGAVPLIGPRDRREARERAGYPKGGRHELMSVALMSAAGPPLAKSATDWTLAAHLVASHHGHCRPFAPWVPDDEPVDVQLDWNGVAVSASSAHHLERLDSGIAEKFWQVVRKYGWWGAAYLEAILRLADQQQSAREQRNR